MANNYIDIDKLIEEKSKELATEWSEYYDNMVGVETAYNVCYNAARSMAKWLLKSLINTNAENNEFKN